ncbi:hypothetical protein ACFLZW_05535 [Chloroflexota bacterium]
MFTKFGTITVFVKNLSQIQNIAHADFSYRIASHPISLSLQMRLFDSPRKVLNTMPKAPIINPRQHCEGKAYLPDVKSKATPSSGTLHGRLGL